MSFETIIKGKIIDSSNNAVKAASVNLKAIKEKNNITGYRDTVSVDTGTTDDGGRVDFDSVEVGKYDIDIIVNGKTYTLFDYEVKNSYLVNPGGSEAATELRTFIRSEEHFSGNAVSSEPRPNVHLGYPLDEYAETFATVGTIVDKFADRLDDSLIQETILIGRETGDTYYRDNQNVKLVQIFTFKLPI